MLKSTSQVKIVKNSKSKPSPKIKVNESPIRTKSSILKKVASVSNLLQSKSVTLIKNSKNVREKQSTQQKALDTRNQNEVLFQLKSQSLLKKDQNKLKNEVLIPKMTKGLNQKDLTQINPQQSKLALKIESINMIQKCNSEKIPYTHPQTPLKDSQKQQTSQSTSRNNSQTRKNKQQNIKAVVNTQKTKRVKQQDNNKFRSQSAQNQRKKLIASEQSKENKETQTSIILRTLQIENLQPLLNPFLKANTTKNEIICDTPEFKGQISFQQKQKERNDKKQLHNNKILHETKSKSKEKQSNQAPQLQLNDSTKKFGVAQIKEASQNQVRKKTIKSDKTKTQNQEMIQNSNNKSSKNIINKNSLLINLQCQIIPNRSKSEPKTKIQEQKETVAQNVYNQVNKKYQRKPNQNELYQNRELKSKAQNSQKLIKTVINPDEEKLQLQKQLKMNKLKQQLQQECKQKVNQMIKSNSSKEFLQSTVRKRKKVPLISCTLFDSPSKQIKENQFLRQSDLKNTKNEDSFKFTSEKVYKRSESEKKLQFSCLFDSFMQEDLQEFQNQMRYDKKEEQSKTNRTLLQYNVQKENSQLKAFEDRLQNKANKENIYIEQDYDYEHQNSEIKLQAFKHQNQSNQLTKDQQVQLKERLIQVKERKQCDRQNRLQLEPLQIFNNFQSPNDSLQKSSNDSYLQLLGEQESPIKAVPVVNFHELTPVHSEESINEQCMIELNSIDTIGSSEFVKQKKEKNQQTKKNPARLMKTFQINKNKLQQDAQKSVPLSFPKKKINQGTRKLSPYHKVEFTIKY